MSAWVFHAGALGDFVMMWPLVRALRGSGGAVMVVADSEKARLAERVIGVRGVGAESRRFTRLWGGEACAEGERERGAELVVSFVAEEESAWVRGARGMFPAARVVCVGAPGSETRAAVWREFRVGERSLVGRRENAAGAVVLHIGAGGAAKRWAIARWEALANTLRETGERVEVIAGEVEVERLSAHEREVFARMRGRFIGSLDELAGVIGAARVFVGADTGPTHLAAQMGVSTLALFGPTEPRVWGPVGASVRVVAPGELSAMEWLEVGRVVEEVVV